MSAPPPESPGYIRGAGSQLNTRLALQVVAGFVLVLLALLVAAYTVSAYHHNARLDRLHDRGVPVKATVSGCVGLASGSGITQTGYQCRATFILDGRQYNEPIGVVDNPLPTGAVIDAVATRGHPPTLATAAEVNRSRSSWTEYILPGVLFLCALAVALAWAILAHRRPRRG